MCPRSAPPLDLAQVSERGFPGERARFVTAQHGRGGRSVEAAVTTDELGPANGTQRPPHTAQRLRTYMYTVQL